MATDGNKRCARCCMVVLDVFNAMMQELMQTHSVPATVLYKIIMNDKKFRWEKVTSNELNMIQTLKSDGFSKLDFTTLYKIAVHFQCLPPPTRLWSANPLPMEITIGDDVERIRQKRNRIFHQIKADISEHEMNEFFLTSTEIGKRIDYILNKTDQDGYKQMIKHYQVCSMEPETTNKYLLANQKMQSFEGINF